MSKNLTRIVLLLVVLTLGFKLNLAKADGGIFPPPDAYTAETTQKALIYYTNQTENLVVLTSFQGNAKNFAWVVPVPSKPEINKANADLFNNLATITKTATNEPDIVYDKSPVLGLGAQSEANPVEVISQKTIDVYDTAVLKATDVNALSNWLVNNGYSFPQEQSQNLKDYVDEGWYFAVAKIKPNLIGGGGITSQLNNGTLTPLRFTFETDKIIYPMKLTGIALTQRDNTSTFKPVADSPIITDPVTKKIPITLYIVTDYKTEQNLLTTGWANWIDKADIKKLNENLGANVISANKLFLTKMSDSVQVKNISDDFIITKATNNDVYPAVPYKTSGFWLNNLIILIVVPLAVLFSPIGLIFIIFILLQLFLKKKWLGILGIIYEFLVSLGFIIFAFVFLIAYDFNLSEVWQEYGFVGGAFAVLLLTGLSIYLTIKILKHHRSIY